MEEKHKKEKKEKENIPKGNNVKTGSEALKEFKKEFKRNQPVLFISRVPEPTLLTFKAIAREEFSGDYGMFLKSLLDYYLDDIRYNDLRVRLFNVEEKVNKLYVQSGLSSRSNILAKTGSGRVLKKQSPEEAAQ